MACSSSDLCMKERELLTITQIKKKIMMEHVSKTNAEKIREGF